MTTWHRRFRTLIVSQFCLSLFPINNFPVLGRATLLQKITGASKLLYLSSQSKYVTASVHLTVVCIFDTYLESQNDQLRPILQITHTPTKPSTARLYQKATSEKPRDTIYKTKTKSSQIR
ncbi:unnamed protein product [Callosobruchus maculatus]|uniref:Uncharacterized protein n=1 Tax=Callosobruchus maculatus TaxID=64391 RepID=A0A653CPN4_CALMS|nr:unnamed protein product [Callosobruchus maculatus]